MNRFIKKALMIFLFAYVIYFFIPVNKFIEIEEIPLNITKIQQIIDFNSDKTVFLNDGNICIMDNITNKSEALFEGNITKIYKFIYNENSQDYFYFCSKIINNNEKFFIMKNDTIVKELFKKNELENQYLRTLENKSIFFTNIDVDSSGENFVFNYYGKVYLNGEEIPYFQNAKFVSFLNNDDRIFVLTEEYKNSTSEELRKKFLFLDIFGVPERKKDGIVLIYLSNNNQFVIPGKIIKLSSGKDSQDDQFVSENEIMVNNFEIFDYGGNFIRRVKEYFYSPNKVNPNNYAIFKGHGFNAYNNVSIYLYLEFLRFYAPVSILLHHFYKTSVYFNNTKLKKFGFIEENHRQEIVYDSIKGNRLAYIVKRSPLMTEGLNLVINNRISKDSYNFLSKIVYNEKLDSFLSIVEKSDGNIYMLRAK